MKKILQWVVPVFLGLAPTWGAEDIADKTFLSKEGIYSISGVYEETGGDGRTCIKAIVDGTFLTQFEGTTETVRREVVARFSQTGWEHNDRDLKSKQKGKVFILANGVKIDAPTSYTRDLEFPYESIKLEQPKEGKFLKGALLQGTDLLPLGERVQVCLVSDYLRPDKTIYTTYGQALYELLREETRVPGTAIRHCQKEWDIISQWKKKTRHEVQAYSRTDVTETTYRIPVGTDEKIIVSQDTVAELKPVQYEGEVPTCGEKQLPAKYRIVN